MRSLVLLFRVLLAMHCIDDGTTCEISRRWWNVHDYHEHKGGDGIPTHFFTYRCPCCGMEFGI